MRSEVVAVSTGRRRGTSGGVGRRMLQKARIEFAMVVLGLSLVCYSSASLGADDVRSTVDITNKKLQGRQANCSDYIGQYSPEVRYGSRVKDVHLGGTFEGSLVISRHVWEGKCVFKTNSIPNHHFNDGVQTFVNPVKKVEMNYEVTVEPKVAPSVTPLSLSYDQGILLNGVKIDLLAAACYCVGGEPLGQEKIGCFSMEWPWRYDPMSPKNDFGADMHNAHAQPDGAYHYHGDPLALYDPKPHEPSPVIGFAADGFPIYGPYFKDKAGVIRPARSGYTLRKGKREHLKHEGCFPGGEYDGRFRDDWEFTNAGDLDECNGMKDEQGHYGYYVTDKFPWVMGCFRGIPDESFKKATGDPGHKH